MKFEIVDSYSQNAVIKVVGVGGGGGNAVNHMVSSNVDGVDFICANTDAQALKSLGARSVIQLGTALTKGLGAGANPEIGRQAALDDRDRILEVLEGADISAQVATFMEDTVTAYVTSATASGFPENWDLETLWQALKLLYPISFTVEEVSAEVGGVAGLDSDFLLNKVLADARAAYAKREESLGVEVVRELERKVLLSVLDRKWREHLYEMDYLQEGIGLRAMAQRDPLVEYQKEGYELFSAMMDAIKEELVALLFNVEVEVERNDNSVEVTPKGVVAPEQSVVPLTYSAADESGEAQSTGGTSRNGPCPCGSGKKYKRCHGAA